MGSTLTKGMEENFKKQQDFMLQMQTGTLQRQIHMQNVMRERMMAMQIARAREMFVWLATGYSAIFLAGVAGFKRSRNPAAIAPLLPLGFMVAYQYDLAHGSKMYRIRDEAERILENEAAIIEMPHGVPTVELIDSRRAGAK